MSRDHCDCCSCYEDGYDDGYNAVLDDAKTPDYDSLFHIDDIHIWPQSDHFIARIDCNFPEGIGQTEKEALGDLVQKLVQIYPNSEFIRFI